MPPAAMALISEPIITFQPTEASMAAIASRTSMVSMELAFSPLSSVGSVKRKMPSLMRMSTVSLGRRRSFWASSPPSRITWVSLWTRSSAVPSSVVGATATGASMSFLEDGCDRAD